MPKRRFSRKGSRKKFTRKRRRVSRRKSIPRNLIPTKLARRFKYATTFQLDPVSGGNVAVHTFTCNGMYDPDITLTGHQPLGFDEYSNFYDHYTVIGAKITVSFNASASTTLVGSARVGISVRDKTDFGGTTNALIEQGATRTAIVSPLSSNNQRTLTYKVNPGKFLGMSKPLNNQNLRGDAISNPQEQCYFIVFAGALDDLANTSVIYCTATIEYTAVLTERKFLSTS